MYKFRITKVQGKLNIEPDGTFRHPVSPKLELQLVTLLNKLTMPYKHQLYLRMYNSIIPSQSIEPLMPPSKPEFSFQKPVAGLLDLHENYLKVYPDRYTGWQTVAKGSSEKARVICNALRNWVSYIQCTRRIIVGRWTTVWLPRIKCILLWLEHKEVDIICTLSSKQWAARISGQNSQKNADRQHQCVCSGPVSGPSGSSH